MTNKPLYDPLTGELIEYETVNIRRKIRKPTVKSSEHLKLIADINSTISALNSEILKTTDPDKVALLLKDKEFFINKKKAINNIYRNSKRESILKNLESLKNKLETYNEDS